MLDIILEYERKKIIETLINNSIIYKNNIEIKKLENNLSTMFVEIEKIIKSTSSLELIQNTIINNFLSKINIIIKNTPGLTIGINDENTNNQIYLYYGKISDKSNQKIDKNTLFDIASVTKIFTAIALLKEQEIGNIDLSKNINYYNSKYKNMDKSLEDISKFYYQINISKKLENTNSKEELKDILYNAYCVDENTFLYSDIPYIILGDILNSINPYFIKTFQKELNMINTSYITKNKIITGSNINSLNKIHDPKAQKMKELGLTNMGHAGIYSTSEDLVKLGTSLLPKHNFLTQKSLITLTTPSHNEKQYLNRKTNELTNKNRAMAVYIQTDKGIKECDMPYTSSRKSFAISGTTGPYMLVDPINNYTLNYLCNPYSQENGKPIININNEDKNWNSATNINKEELINLVYELRYTTKVFETLAKVYNKESTINEVNKILKTKKRKNLNI